MHTTIYSATPVGVSAYPVAVEVDFSLGMMQFFVLGLPDAAIRESRQRIMTALKNSGCKLPERKITVNLAPADLKKEGMLFDVPIAIGMLQAAGMLNASEEWLSQTWFLGELSLDGSVRPVRGVLPIAVDAASLGIKRLVVPQENAFEAALIPSIDVIGVSHISQLVAYVRGELVIPPTPHVQLSSQQRNVALDLAQVKGQRQGKRALQIAAAGRHNLLLVGSPGSGKTMLAQRIVSLMPELSYREMLEVSKVYSTSGKLRDHGLVTTRPFRAPHHTISTAGLIGGGSYPVPGEISLAHHGVLFLDELTEFRRTTLEALRQPLEDGEVSIARAQQTLTFPSDCLLIAAFNPCPCGYAGDSRRACVCDKKQIAAYLRKLSGPFLDRMDVQLHVPSVDYSEMSSATSEVSSTELWREVERALAQQAARAASKDAAQGDVLFNGRLTAEQIEQVCIATPGAQRVLRIASEKLQVSMRGYHKLLKVSRTIADLAGSEYIEEAHVTEALLYRSIDRYMQELIGA